ncbi:hypothetical protein Dimus_024148, partial [Dionaea muscipula]
VLDIRKVWRPKEMNQGDRRQAVISSERSNVAEPNGGELRCKGWLWGLLQAKGTGSWSE